MCSVLWCISSSWVAAKHCTAPGSRAPSGNMNGRMSVHFEDTVRSFCRVDSGGTKASGPPGVDAATTTLSTRAVWRASSAYATLPPSDQLEVEERVGRRILSEGSAVMLQHAEGLAADGSHQARQMYIGACTQAHIHTHMEHSITRIRPCTLPLPITNVADFLHTSTHRLLGVPAL